MPLEAKLSTSLFVSYSFLSCLLSIITDIFFVPAANLVVEIKSLFTLSRDFDIVRQKILSAQTKGYKVLLLVFDRYGRVALSPAEIDLLLTE